MVKIGDSMNQITEYKRIIRTAIKGCKRSIPKIPNVKVVNNHRNIGFGLHTDDVGFFSWCDVEGTKFKFHIFNATRTSAKIVIFDVASTKQFEEMGKLIRRQYNNTKKVSAKNHICNFCPFVKISQYEGL
jgi:hypothetical protein